MATNSFDRYVRSIRNAKKKAYAQRYVRWVRGGRKGKEPDEGGLSFMGAQAVRLRVAEIQKGNPMSKEKNPTHNVPYSGTVDYLKPAADRLSFRGREIAESKKGEMELTSGGMIRLRNPKGQASCPGCGGIIKNPKPGTGKCSGCGALVVIERDTSGFYQPSRNPTSRAPFFEVDNSGLYTAGSPRGVVGNPRGQSDWLIGRAVYVHGITLSKPDMKRFHGRQGVVKRVTDRLKGKRLVPHFLIRFADGKAPRSGTFSIDDISLWPPVKNPEGGFEYDFSGFYSQGARGPYPVLNPHRGRRRKNPSSADIQKGTCPTCGANLILASGVTGGSCPKCQSVVRVG